MKVPTVSSRAGARRRRASGTLAGSLVLAAVAVGCAPMPSSPHVIPGGSVYAGRHPSLATLLGAVNALYSNTQPPFVATLPATPRPAGMSAARAAGAAIVACDDGVGTKIVATALVNTSLGQDQEWAVFLDPPGPHFGIFAGLVPPKNPAILNWYAAFVPVRGSMQIFCAFGSSRRLPALPVFDFRK